MSPGPPDPTFVDQVAALIEAGTGLSARGSRREAFERAARSCLGSEDSAALLEKIAAGGDVLRRLTEEVTVFETYFFREPRQLQHLQDEILPEVARRRGDEAPLRVWSAGCSTGEEAYTLAIILDQMGLGSRARVLGTDLSERALKLARAGRYGDWSLRATPPDVVEGYFKTHHGRFQVSEAVRQMVDFRHENLLGPDGGTDERFDLILCRNVFIYFNSETARAAAPRLVARLDDGGWLVLGAADPLLPGIDGTVTTMTAGGAFYRRGAESPAARVPDAESPSTQPTKPSVPTQSTATEAAPQTPRPKPNGLEAPRRAAAGPDAAAQAYRTGHPDAALDAMRAADDGSASSWVALSRALANEGRLDDALHALVAALDRHPDAIEVRLMHALILGESGSLEGAIRMAREALYLQPSSPVGHLSLALFLARAGSPERAHTHYGTAARLLNELDPDAVLEPFQETAAELLALVRRQQALALTREAS